MKTLLSAFSLFLLSSLVALPQINECAIHWTRNGQAQNYSYVYAGQTYSIERDPGTAVSFSVWPTSTAPSPRIYYLVDMTNGINVNSGSTTQGYWYFENNVGSAATEVWLYVNSMANGLIKISVNNYVPPLPDLTVTSITFDGTTQLSNYQSGETVDISCRVDNNGSGTAGTSYLGIYLGSSPTDFGNRIASKSVMSLSGLQGVYVNHSYTFQDGDIGTKYFLFRADRTNLVTESFEDNNTAYRGSFSITGVPLNITVNQPSADIQVAQGQPVNFTWTGAGSGATTVSLRRDNDNIWENGTGESNIAASLPVSGSYSWNTQDLPAGTYYIAAVIYSTNDYSYDYASGRVIINPLTASMEIAIKNIDGSGTPLPGNEGRVRLFNSSGGQVGTEQPTNDLGEVTFTNVPAGSGYYYEVYHDPIDPPTPFGREYWGKRTDLTIPPANPDVFVRDQPYGDLIQIWNGDQNVTGQTVQAGTPLTIRYTMYNPKNVAQYAKGNVLLDRDNTDPYDLSIWGSERILIPANSSAVQEMSFIPQYAGTYYAAGGVDISTTGDAFYTDGGKWGQEPILIITPSGGTMTRVEPFSFPDLSVKPGCLVLFQATFEYFFNNDPLEPLKLNNKKVRFEINFNDGNGWINIDDDGISTTSLVTDTKGIASNYFLAPDNLVVPAVYQIKAVFDGDTEYQSTFFIANLNGIQSETGDLELVWPDNPSEDNTPLILVHGNGSDGHLSDMYRWQNFINYINNLENDFSNFDVYVWRHDTELPIGFNGTTGNARELSIFLDRLISSHYNEDTKAILVAHSRGGLVCRSFMVNNTDKVLGLITLGTPHHGSPFAVPDWTATLWGNKFQNGIISGEVYNTLINTGKDWGIIGSPTQFDYDRIGSVNLSWDNLDNVIAGPKPPYDFPSVSFAVDGEIWLSDKDMNISLNEDKTILYGSEIWNSFGTLAQLNLNEANFSKIITFGAYDDDLADNVELSLASFAIAAVEDDHYGLSLVTNLLAYSGESISDSQSSFYANDGLVPLQSALLLDISGGPKFSDILNEGIYINSQLIADRQKVKAQHYLLKSSHKIGDHLDLLDGDISDPVIREHYWDVLANEIRSFLPSPDLILPTVNYNNITPDWSSSNPLIDINFYDEKALQSIWYQLNSNDDSNPSNWHNLTLDGITILSESLNNQGTFLATDWKISNEDWDNLTFNAENGGKHYIYFKVTDDAGNVYITPDQASAFEFGKDDVPPNVSFNTPNEGDSFSSNLVTVTWSADDIVAGLALSGIDFIYLSLDNANNFMQLPDDVRSFTFDELQSGSHTVYLKATDVAGNESALKELHFSVNLQSVLERTSGNNQSGLVSSALSQPFVVGVEDVSGNGIEGVEISFEIVSAPSGATGQSLSTSSVTTNTSGQAGTILTLGNLPGQYVVSASSEGLSGSPVTFTATAITNPVLPTLVTAEISSLAPTSATSGGTITSDGGSAILSKGVCWSTSPEPTINDFITSDGSGPDGFTSSLTDLTPGTTYHVRAYAINSEGPGYGNDIVFTTESISPYDYEIKFDNLNASGWFGGDDRSDIGPRNEGNGQSVYIDSDINLKNFSFFFTGSFDYHENPEYFGHEVTLILNIRNSDGIIISTKQVTVPASFTGGWVTWSDINLNVLANSTLIFTCNLLGAYETAQYYNGIGADADAGYAGGVRYVKGGISDADMDLWTGWSVHDWDSNFWLQGTRIPEPGLIAHYPLIENASDRTGNYPDMTLSNVTISNEGIDCNGIYDGQTGSIANTPTIDGISYDRLTFYTEFRIGEYPASSYNPVLVAGAGAGDRWLGFAILPDGRYSLRVNNFDEVDVSTSLCPLNEWHSAAITYNSNLGLGRLYIDGTLACEAFFTLDLSHANKSIGIVNSGTGMAFKGHQRNIKIYNDIVINPLLPVVVTSAINNIAKETADGGGTTLSEGASGLISQGVCWSTNQNPTPGLQSKTTDGDTPGSFISSVSDLTPGATYYLRAYATNSYGTGYGKEITFKTYNADAVQDIDGNYYNIVTIGSQIWMAENLKTATLNDGAPIFYIYEGSDWFYYGSTSPTSGFCWYDNNGLNKDIYGGLYNWHAVNTGVLCPVGWHVPTRAEFETLISFAGGESLAGDKLKEAGNTTWLIENFSATNEYGFTARPGGIRAQDTEGPFYHLGYMGLWWSSTLNDDFLPYWMYLSAASSGTSINIENRGSGLSVRCIKDNVVEQSVDLTSGWNILSFTAEPSDRSMLSIVDPLRVADVLVKVQDEEGKAVEQLSIGWINGIGEMAVTEGYKIRVTEETSLSITGEPVTLPLDIPLEAGWNIIGFPSENAQLAETVFAPMVSAGTLVKVQDDEGNAIENLGGGWSYGITMLEPGKGYSVKSSDNTILTIGNGTKGGVVSEKRERAVPVHFRPGYVGKGLDHMNIYLGRGETESGRGGEEGQKTQDALVHRSFSEGGGLMTQGRSLETSAEYGRLGPGDEIGVFDGDICVGAVVVEGGEEKYIRLTASYDDPVTKEKDGFTEGNTLELRLWGRESRSETVLSKTEPAKGYSMIFERQGTTVLTTQIEGKRESWMGDAYPNPSAERTTFTFRLAEECRVSLEVYDVMGNKVAVLVDELLPEGYYEREWDNRATTGNKAKSGVYFYRLRLNEISQIKQLVIR